MKTATLMGKKPSMDGVVQRRHYRLSEPIAARDWPGGEASDHVIVSASVVSGVPETYIFTADASGNIKSWVECDGSFRGALDHDEALRRAGYEVAP